MKKTLKNPQNFDTLEFNILSNWNKTSLGGRKYTEELSPTRDG